MRPPHPALLLFALHGCHIIVFVTAFATFVVARQYSDVKDQPARKARGKSWWAWVESNYRPHPYQGCALAN